MQRASGLTQRTFEEDFFFQCLEHLPVAIYVMTAEGKPYYSNKRSADLLGKTAAAATGPEDLAETYQAYRAGTDELYQFESMPIVRALKGERCRVDDIVLKRGTREIFINVTSAPILDADGKIAFAVAVTEDVTEKKHMEDELRAAINAAEKANRAKSRFVASMSHELRTPLNSILGYSELLQEEAEDLGAGRLLPDLRKINSAGKHLLELITGVLDFSKIEAGKMNVYLEYFDVVNVVNDTVQSVLPLAAKNRNTILTNLSDAAITMHSDMTKIRQILLNLLSNAAKFSHDSEITLNVRQEEEVCIFQVSDNGIGMTETQMVNLFQAFEQADMTTTRNFGGTGLGLALTRELCEILGGTISATSIPAKGSVFTATLPMRAIMP